MARTSSREVISTRQQKIVALARMEPTRQLRTMLDQRVRYGVYLPSRSDALIRGAGCGNSARPDLWEPWVGDCPGPPDFRA